MHVKLKTLHSVFFKMISLHFYLFYILYALNLSTLPMGKLPDCATPLKCIKTSSNQHRILSRCHRCFMESGHELSPSMARATRCGILFVTVNMWLLNVPPLFVLSCCSTMKWVRSGFISTFQSSSQETQRQFSKSGITHSWLIIKGNLYVWGHIRFLLSSL